MDFDLLLIKKMKQGDENAFDVFVRRHYEEIVKYCSYHCLDTAYAEDLTQETFLRFFENLSDYRYIGKTRNYLYTIAGNLCKDYYKKTKERFWEDAPAKIQSSLQTSETEDILNKITVQTALNSLPEELREILILYYFQELKLTEISDLLGIGLPLVKYRMKQARTQLKKRLSKE